MKRLIAICLVCAVIFGLMNQADAYSTGFEDLSYGSYSAIVYPWVEFTDNMGFLSVENKIPGPDFSGTHSVRGPGSLNPAERYIADILVPGIRSVSVVMGDYDEDSDSLYLEAYNVSSQLIGTDYESLPSHVYGGPTLSVSTMEDIAYVHFYSGPETACTVYFDNFTAEVPEPATITLLGLGSLVLHRGRKKRE